MGIFTDLLQLDFDIRVYGHKEHKFHANLAGRQRLLHRPRTVHLQSGLSQLLHESLLHNAVRQTFLPPGPSLLFQAIRKLLLIRTAPRVIHLPDLFLIPHEHVADWDICVVNS